MNTTDKRKVAIVTGAGQGIGLRICEMLAASGKHVILNDINPELCQLAAMKVNLRGTCTAMPGDAGDTGFIQEMVERAAKLMGTERPKQEQKRVVSESTSTGDLRQMLREVVEEVLRDNGVIAESSQKANETIMFKVGEHIFEGKVTKIKKVRKQ